MDIEFAFNKTAIVVPANLEIVFCTKSLNSTSSDRMTHQEEVVNGFGLQVYKRRYSRQEILDLNHLSSNWLLLNPSEQLKKFPNDQVDNSIPLRNHNVTLAFGCLISPFEFKCAGSQFVHQISGKLFFGKHHSCMSISAGNSRFTLRRDHVDSHRGVIIHVKSTFDVVVFICLRGNLEEYELQQRENGYLSKRFYLKNADGGEEWQPGFSALHLSIQAKQNSFNSIHTILSRLIQFFSYHSVPVYFGSIKFSFQKFIYGNIAPIPTCTFTCQYAWQMLISVGCRIYDQLINQRTLYKYMLQLSNWSSDEGFYYVMERLRRLALSSEGYFLNIIEELPSIVHHYHDVYLKSVFHETDAKWTNYVRIPWFCFTPTRLIVKPFKFMRSNRVFRYIDNIAQSMAFVEFRDDTGSAYLSADLVPFLKHYLEKGFYFGERHYIYLHHAQSQIRNKQFYFYCENEGGMTREQLEKWMGNFDDERLPAKNTARRTHLFPSTEATITIDKVLVDTIPDVKTVDRKYNFTDGVGQISSELNILIHEAININADEGDYISSVLQIRYGGCKGTITVNPHLDGQRKQLLIRPSMNKFKCDHQILELCKRSLQRRLCLNREVINLLSYRGISSECLLVFQLQNILWLISSLLSRQSALSVLREKVLGVFSWLEISRHRQLWKEPFFRRLLHTTISNNLYQLKTRAHIRVPQARYMFGIVDEYKVLQEGQVFVQITNEDGTRTVLEGVIAITKNPCRHPGDLRVLQAVNNGSLHHLYDVLVFPQQGSRPHASEISGSDLDGDEYTVIWDPKLIPTSPNSPPYDYDSGPAPQPLNRVVTRDDRLKVILDICEQDNLGKLSNIHLVLCDKFGIDSDDAIFLAAGLSQELDSVKSGQHPYSTHEIKDINSKTGTTRPDFMHTAGYKEYQSDKILGKLFRSAHHLSNLFSTTFPDTNFPTAPDPTLLHDGYGEYIDFAQQLYQQYKYEMLEIIGCYGFTNEIDLFCCVESRNMNASERGDTQQTAQKLLKAVFRHIRNQFRGNNSSLAEAKAKAAACYYVAYTDDHAKDQGMLSFPWLFASQLLAHCPTISDDEEAAADFMCSLVLNDEKFTPTEILELYSQRACETKHEQWINRAEVLIEQLILFSKTIQSN